MTQRDDTSTRAPHRPPAWSNFRDLGGLPVVGGGRTATGMLYRSDAPYPGDEAPSLALTWPPARVVDLRHEGESDRLFDWPSRTDVCPYPLFAAAAPDRQAEGLGPLYQHMLDRAPDRIAAVTDLVTHGEAPALVHCTAGKDRTGVVVAILLDAAGVEPEAIVADYGLTAHKMRTVMARMQGLGGIDVHRVPVQLFLSCAAAIQAVLDRTRSADDGSYGWLVSHGADAGALTRWIRRFTQDAARR